IDGKVNPVMVEMLTVGEKPRSSDQVRDDALTALAREIRLMLDEGVVAEPQDIDLCLILGAGWPFHLGGVTPYLDRTRVSRPVAGSSPRAWPASPRLQDPHNCASVVVLEALPPHN